MSLSQAIAERKAAAVAKMPSDIVETFGRTTKELIDSGIDGKALGDGDKAPTFALPNATGKTIDLANLLKDGPVVISFYRGAWCPYCNLEVGALQAKLPEIEAAGAKLIAISPELPDNSLEFQEKNELTFEVLSDQGNKVARQFGLVFTLHDDLKPIYTKFGFDLSEKNGDDSWELPLPATYVIAQDGTIAKSFVSADYTARMEPEDVVAALKRLT